MVSDSCGLLDEFATAAAAARAVIAAPGLLDSAVAGLDSERAAVRFHSSKVLLEVARLSPQALMPRLGDVLALLESDNQLIRSAAFRTLGHASPADAHGRITRALGRFLAPLAGPQLVVANNAMDGAALVALAKPQVTERVVRALLAVPDGTWPTPDCRRIVAKHAAAALLLLRPQSRRQQEIDEFVREHGAPRKRRAGAARAGTRTPRNS